ncbi:hypothetical protein CAPTEDRAFT_203635 [Capitella teleta]|uniref:Uncharacterized protein n=1 Tax=Capitella teleta TaxID=283909 RepID=R7V327_CAPTE|nr:hypothetical protein CAPTEDRAFT_203635 [Capitella teleta]|eukprot:ELU10721.1 hypothetical protein CAPTEDRAFT_203635 [Capitella teleta]
MALSCPVSKKKKCVLHVNSEDLMVHIMSNERHVVGHCMKARLMLAALSWNALQRSNATEKVDVVKWSKRKGAWVLEERRKKQASDSVPPQLKSLMSRVVEVASQHLQLPPIAEPKLQRRGCHVAKPSKEELRHL